MCPRHLSPVGETPQPPATVPSPWQTVSCPSQVAHTSGCSGTHSCSSWCSSWQWRCPAHEPPGWAARGHEVWGRCAAESIPPECLGQCERPPLPGWGSASKPDSRKAEQPRPGRKVPGTGSPTYAENDALQCVLRLTEEPPADLRGAGGYQGQRRRPRCSRPRTRVTSCPGEGRQGRLSATLTSSDSPQHCPWVHSTQARQEAWLPSRKAADTGLLPATYLTGRWLAGAPEVCIQPPVHPGGRSCPQTHRGTEQTGVRVPPVLTPQGQRNSVRKRKPNANL